MKQQLMDMEFQYNMQLAQLKVGGETQKLQTMEDRKDERTKIQASQQSELINQRKNNALPQKFESNQLEDFEDMGY